MTGHDVAVRRVKSLGHVALRVRDLRRSESFYADVLGLPVSGRMGADMTFFRVSADRFQDLALMQCDGGVPERGSVGLDHVAFNVGDSANELRAVKARLAAQGIAVKGPIDHAWSLSLYLADPDGNGIELYVDQSDHWKHDRDFTPTARLLGD